MKANERRLLVVFLVLAALMGGAILSQRLLEWDHRLDRSARDLELAKMESDLLIGQAPYWKASNEWIQRTQPVAASGYDAGNNILGTLRHAATGAGFDIQKTQMEPVVETGYYRQVWGDPHREGRSSEDTGVDPCHSGAGRLLRGAASQNHARQDREVLGT